jgi:hypothetical protein
MVAPADFEILAWTFAEPKTPSRVAATARAAVPQKRRRFWLVSVF